MFGCSNWDERELLRAVEWRLYRSKFVRHVPRGTFQLYSIQPTAVEDISSDISDTSEKSFAVIRREDLSSLLVETKTNGCECFIVGEKRDYGRKILRLCETFCGF